MVPHHISQWYASHGSQFCKLKFLIRQLLTNQSVNLNRASQSIQSIYQLFLIHLVNTMIMTESEWVDLVNVTLIWMSRSIWSIIKSISIGQTIHLVNTKSIWMSQSIHLVNHQVNLNEPINPSGQPSVTPLTLWQDHQSIHLPPHQPINQLSHPPVKQSRGEGEKL